MGLPPKRIKYYCRAEPGMATEAKSETKGSEKVARPEA